MTRSAGSVLLMTTVLAAVGLAACERGDPGAEPGAAPQDTTEPVDDHVPPMAPEGGVTVTLIDAEGHHVGGARLEDVPEGVRLSIRIRGLSEGEHGLHFHETGQCDPPEFQSAGGHFAPHGGQHGFMNPQGPHAGDLPNIRANAEGVADTSFVSTTVRLSRDAPEGLLRPGGTALVVHAGPDDYRTDPAGDSGARVACGVVRED
jgi:superoxide dismutase, Cu-Zn family